MRAWCESTEVREPLPYMVRNENIVKEAGVLIAAPASDKEVMRSGTWATVRRGRAAKKPVFVMQQNGNVPKGR